MTIIENLIEELKSLEEVKKKYEYVEEAKKVMSDMLLDYMKKEYDKSTYSERCAKYNHEICKDCFHRHGCVIKNDLPKNILEPIPSNNNYIPARRTCGNFKWS